MQTRAQTRKSPATAGLQVINYNCIAPASPASTPLVAAEWLQLRTPSCMTHSALEDRGTSDMLFFFSTMAQGHRAAAGTVQSQCFTSSCRLADEGTPQAASSAPSSGRTCSPAPQASDHRLPRRQQTLRNGECQRGPFMNGALVLAPPWSKTNSWHSAEKKKG